MSKNAKGYTDKQKVDMFWPINGALSRAENHIRKLERELDILRKMASCARMNRHTRGGIPAGIEVALNEYEIFVKNPAPFLVICGSYICHGPGHQSKSFCEMKGPHSQHSLSSRGLYWSTKTAFSGYFDQSPEDQGEPRRKKLVIVSRAK